MAKEKEKDLVEGFEPSEGDGSSDKEESEVQDGIPE